MSTRRPLAAALAAIYLVWGSTYLAIAIAVRTLPPLLMAATRFVTAGLGLYLVLRARGYETPTRRELAGASLTGILLLGGGNGLVCLTAHALPSGVIALVIATTPLWMALIPWAVGGEKPSSRALAGIGLGLAGVAVLSRASLGDASSSPLGPFAVIVLASLSWSIGSTIARRITLPSKPIMTTALQMLAGGAALLVVATLRGELALVDLERASLESVLALAYLAVFGSIVGFGAYTWLLKNTSPTLATSYAYVNPLVALLLGHLIADEPLGLETAIASALIVTAVLLTVTAPKPAAT